MPAADAAGCCNAPEPKATNRHPLLHEPDHERHLPPASPRHPRRLGRRARPPPRCPAPADLVGRRDDIQDPVGRGRRHRQRQRHADRGVRRRLLLGRAGRVPAGAGRLAGGLRIRRRQGLDCEVRDGHQRHDRPRRVGEDHLRPEEGELRHAAAHLLLGRARPDPAQPPGSRRRLALPLGRVLRRRRRKRRRPRNTSPSSTPPRSTAARSSPRWCRSPSSSRPRRTTRTT